MKTIKAQLILNVERPNGEREQVDVSDKYLTLNEQIAERIFRDCQKATKAAGRGNIYSYEYTPAPYEYTAEEEEYNAIKKRTLLARAGRSKSIRN